MDLGKVLDQTQEIMKKERVVHLNDKLRIEVKEDKLYVLLESLVLENMNKLLMK